MRSRLGVIIAQGSLKSNEGKPQKDVRPSTNAARLVSCSE